MRRLLACTALAASLAAAAPAVAAPKVCTPEKLTVGVCAEYVCVDICGPEVVVTTWCNLDSHPRVLACDLLNN